MRAPELRDNGKPNREHDYDEDPETGCCVICGWAELCHDFAPDAADLPALRERPRVICLCGSTRFIEQFATTTWELERAGNIVLGCTLLPLWYCGCAEHFGEKTGTKAQCDEHHLRKIDLADEVLVLDIGGYIGNSTRREIAYAEAHGKTVRYASADPDLLLNILPPAAASRRAGEATPATPFALPEWNALYKAYHEPEWNPGDMLYALRVLMNAYKAGRAGEADAADGLLAEIEACAQKFDRFMADAAKEGKRQRYDSEESLRNKANEQAQMIVARVRRLRDARARSLHRDTPPSPAIALCPLCQGRGYVPPGFYTSTPGQPWSASSTASETCRSCDGKGYVRAGEAQQEPTDAADRARSLHRDGPDWKTAALLKDRTRAAIRERYQAGESTDALAADYGVPGVFIEQLVSWQMCADATGHP